MKLWKCFAIFLFVARVKSSKSLLAPIENQKNLIDFVGGLVNTHLKTNQDAKLVALINFGNGQEIVNEVAKRISKETSIYFPRLGSHGSSTMMKASFFIVLSDNFKTVS